ncbi:DUF2161 family putative PD-(D/E)XK-type phosphodiesterase [Alphaproteobacteria bacterium]|nr:DUF2161 family putative PD-(D/E)XK-type phosphodiesterase [Alphaproteobacteria bacterium]
MPETDLYPPLKSFLKKQGYTVKAEVGAADIVALRGDQDILIIELKTAFSLSLFHQCIARQAITDDVYLAVPQQAGKRFLKSLNENKKLARRLGLGVITVRLSDGLVEVHQDPGPFKPRKSTQKQDRLLHAFARLRGDPNQGGSTRQGLVTGYRQDALHCAAFLAKNGVSKGASVAKATGVTKATTIMRDNHYGWFQRPQTGFYELSLRGQSEWPTWSTKLTTDS